MYFWCGSLVVQWLPQTILFISLIYWLFSWLIKLIVSVYKMSQKLKKKMLITISQRKAATPYIWEAAIFFKLFLLKMTETITLLISILFFWLSRHCQLSNKGINTIFKKCYLVFGKSLNSSVAVCEASPPQDAVRPRSESVEFVTCCHLASLWACQFCEQLLLKPCISICFASQLARTIRMVSTVSCHLQVIEKRVSPTIRRRSASAEKESTSL